MEVKDLTRRLDKQDQTLGDMQTGMTLLSKSIGPDEIDTDSMSTASRRHLRLM